MKWKITNKKYERLRILCLITCAIGMIIYFFLVRHVYNVNPDAFIYNPMQGETNHWADLEDTIWYVVIIGFVIVGFLFYRTAKKNPKHWLNKINEVEIEEKEEEGENK